MQDSILLNKYFIVQIQNSFHIEDITLQNEHNVTSWIIGMCCNTQ